MKSLYFEKFVKIGFIRKPHGYKGWSKIDLEDAYWEDALEQEFWFVEIDGYKVPLRCVDTQAHPDTMVKFEDWESDVDVRRYQLLPLYMLASATDQQPAVIDGVDEAAFIGVTVHDLLVGEVGPILRIDKYPQQLIAVVEYGDREVLIPLHEELIRALDMDNRILKMELPEGLLSIGE